jgi:hypothetical protein
MRFLFYSDPQKFSEATVSNLAFAFAGGLMDKERQAKYMADYQRGLNLAVNAAEPEPLAPDAMPITTPDAYAKFPVGTPVRDFLSGIEGVVAAPPEGEFGDVVFITGNEDGKTYAVRFDQVKAVEGAPGAALPPPITELPGAPAPEAAAPGAEAGLPPTMPAIEPASLKANAAKYREHLRAKAELIKMAASINDKSLVVAANDERKLTYGQLKAHLNAMGKSTAKDALDFIGYVPRHFDAVWAALGRDGVKIAAANALFHVEQMVKKGLTANEIKMIVCSSNGGVLGKLIANMPPTAKPTEPAPAGMTYVWDSKIGEWTTVAASLATKAEGDDSMGKPVEVSHTDNKAPASGAPNYPVEHNKDEGKTGGGKDSEGEVVKVATQDGKSPASGAPAYPTLDPEKAGGMKANAEVDSLGKPVEVKTYDKKAPASGAPNYPVADPANGGEAPRDKSAADSLGEVVDVASNDNKAPASGAPNYPVLDPDKAGGQAAPGAKPQMTPNATAPAATPTPVTPPVAEGTPAPTEPKPDAEHLAEDKKDFEDIKDKAEDVEKKVETLVKRDETEEKK